MVHLKVLANHMKNNPLNDLDTEFYDLSKIENLSELRIKYIRTHKLEFIDK